MALFRDMDCVGCETCHNCGKRKWYWTADCDLCNKRIEDAGKLYRYDGEMLCFDCAYKLLLEDGIVEKVDGCWIFEGVEYDNEDELFDAIKDSLDIVKEREFDD